MCELTTRVDLQGVAFAESLGRNSRCENHSGSRGKFREHDD